MIPAEYALTLRTRIERMGLSKKEASALLDCPPRTLYQWMHAAGTVHPVIMADAIARLDRLQAARVSKKVLTQA